MPEGWGDESAEGEQGSPDGGRSAWDGGREDILEKQFNQGFFNC